MSISRRILLADDDLEVRSGVVDLLTGIGLSVLEAENGLEALALARSSHVDAALLDLHMPGCTGLEALPLLRAERAGLPCLVYSGDWTRTLEEEALAAGAIGILHKPIQPELLRREVLRAVETGLFPPEPQN